MNIHNSPPGKNDDCQVVVDISEATDLTESDIEDVAATLNAEQDGQAV